MQSIERRTSLQADAARTGAPPFGRVADAAAMRRRRRIFIALNAVTIAGLFWGMAHLMAYGGFAPIEMVMLAAYFVTLPWLSIGFWNGLIGFLLTLRHRNPAVAVNPALARAAPEDPIVTRTAIAMAIRHEDVDAIVERLERMHQDIAATGLGAHFDFHVLSDSAHQDVVLAEERAIRDWRRRAPKQVAIHYRRREENAGFKAGNIREFCDRTRAEYDFFLPLDADSFMSASAILRLVRAMQAAPEIGILQGLVVGEASELLFTRMFQFGMRHGMRSYTLGSAWWQGDCGPFWGHNALIRMKAFQEHCRLPVLSGTGPFSGDILSHDQVEAALMRRAGYEVRVLAAEDESFEINPPSLPDFIKRESRWCQGNMQYWRLLGMRGLTPTSRVQLLLAIWMYLNGPAWMLFIALGAALAAFTDQFVAVPLAEGLALFAVIMFFNLMPKLMGVAQSLADARAVARYGGRRRILAGAAGEFLFSTLIAPPVAVAIAICCIGLLCGSRIRWATQQRLRAYLTIGEAARSLWPQTAFGLALAALLWVYAPGALAFGALVVGPLVLAIPLASLMTSPGLSRRSVRSGLFAAPEEGISRDRTSRNAVQAAA